MEQKYTQSDLMTLFKSVCKKNIKLDANSITNSIITNGFFNSDTVNETIIFVNFFNSMESYGNILNKLVTKIDNNKHTYLLSKDKLIIMKTNSEYIKEAIDKLKMDGLYINFVEEIKYNPSFTDYITRVAGQMSMLTTV
jgi:hypothetical protein